MDKNTFRNKIASFNSVLSSTGKKYSSIKVNQSSVEFTRENKNQSEKLNLDELYQFFRSGEELNTTNARKYISGRVQSPAVALLRALTNNNIKATSKPSPQATSHLKVAPIKNDKDETKFFQAFSELIGKEYLISKSIGKALGSHHVYLSNNYKDYGFKPQLEKCYLQILNALNANGEFTSKSLSHLIDGLVDDHPILGNRIVEFDEEQHFTPARKDSLKYIQKCTNNKYLQTYINICDDLNYLQKSVLKKHRIKNALEQTPSTFLSFVNWLQNEEIKVNGYIKEKANFNYIGGRIAQRTYYDCLRDTAHLSPKNENLQSPIRISKYEVESQYSCSFKQLSIGEIKNYIRNILATDYNLYL